MTICPQCNRYEISTTAPCPKCGTFETPDPLPAYRRYARFMGAWGESSVSDAMLDNNMLVWAEASEACDRDAAETAAADAEGLSQAGRFDGVKIAPPNGVIGHIATGTWTEGGPDGGGYLALSNIQAVTQADVAAAKVAAGIEDKCARCEGRAGGCWRCKYTGVTTPAEDER